MEVEGKPYCQKCGKSMSEKNFYMDRQGNHIDVCKKCLTLHFDPFDPETFKWILKKLDYPYIEAVWNTTRTRYYAKKPLGSNPAPVLGNYLAKMRLGQWSGNSWADTEQIAEEARKAEEKQAQKKAEFQEQLKTRFDKGEINEVEYQTLMTADTFDKMQELQQIETYKAVGLDKIGGSSNQFNENYYIREEDLPNPAAELTDEDKKYLAMKWGRLYKPEEWIELEKKYEEMCKSFDIQDSDTIGALILTCKTYLKMNQAINLYRSPLNFVNLIRGVIIY
ncbi:MAG: hypothetical protein [Caudoviricetes sp.]|nr:MAG: hypothetical protein [Caudoviricetes sp.]